MNQRFEEAKTIYKKLGIDVDEALKQLQTFLVGFKQQEIIQGKQEIIRS